MADNELKKFLSEVVGCVEANGFERFMLWREEHNNDDALNFHNVFVRKRL